MSSAAIASEDVRPVRHDAVVRGLWRAAAAERLPHALLFHGRRGIGKYRSARWLAQGLFCARGVPSEGGEPCGACGPCRRFVSGNHPDVLAIDPVAAQVETLRLHWLVRREDSQDGEIAEEFLSLKPAEGGWRAVLVREAERLNDEAQNAMLKMLEEPGRRTLWVLESARPEALFDTVRSRCCAVRFDPLTPAEVRAVLAAQGLGDADAELFARWSRGSPGDALALSAKGARAMREILAGVLSGARPPLEGARELAEVEGEFQGDKPSARERDRARSAIDLALEVLADCNRAAAGAPAAGLAHGDLAAAPLAGGRARNLRALEALLVARADIDQNLDPKAALERAFQALAPAAPARTRTAPR